MHCNGEIPTIYLSHSTPTTTVSFFLMWKRHLVYTFFILNFLCTPQAHYKVFRSNGKVYRNSAIPHLPRWNNKRNIAHIKNMENLWRSDSLSCILQQIKVRWKFFTCLRLGLFFWKLKGGSDKREKSYIQGVQIKNKHV